MKILVSFSGGKDSLASLIWAIATYGRDKIEAVFCDTGWEHEITYTHILEVTAKLNVKLVILKSTKYAGMIDLAAQKKRFPSTKARFCTQELKTKPMIDYVLTQTQSLIIIQGIRADESESRSKMAKQCTYFKYYFQPYGKDKKGRDKYHYYRKKDIKQWLETHADEVIRPIFEWTGQEVINFILDAGLKPNPLYYMGMSRVGCMPCIMSKHSEIKEISKRFPEVLNNLAIAEDQLGTSFFAPEKIPARFCSKSKNGKTYPTAKDVESYVNRLDGQIDMFKEPDSDHRCMSFYGICE